MCGILGYYSFGNKRPSKEKITSMFISLQSRGKDASGFAYVHDGKLFVYKDAVPSSELIKRKSWKRLVLPKCMILHTRLMTKGTNKNNMNNHPLFTKEGLCIVHNGMIYNDDEIFAKHNSRDADVDSEAVLRLLSLKSKDNISLLFEEAVGSFAVAVIDTRHPDSLTLIKKDNPIELYFDRENDILYFCSERGIMQNGLDILKHDYRGFNLGEDPFFYFEMGNNHALRLSNDGIGSYKSYRSRINNLYSFEYPKTEYTWDDPVEIECPWCYGITLYHEGKLINYCRQCGLMIREEDVINYY